MNDLNYQLKILCRHSRDGSYRTRVGRERQTANGGLSKMHGLRHAYAQRRYEELTGWACPHAGGPSQKGLSPDQRERDGQARLIVSQELGHVRAQIVAVYCGV
ncbi:hypothetical protein ACFL3Y_00845 [Pseudomonadota bacterium]